jgi:hypothetical protein
MRQFLLVAVLSAMSVNALAETGKIRICRHPGLTEIGDKKTIPLPTGSQFTTSGPTNEFVVSTTADATLGPKPACVTVPAELKDNFQSQKVTRRAGRLVAQFAAGSTLEATVIQDFK